MVYYRILGYIARMEKKMETWGLGLGFVKMKD